MGEWSMTIDGAPVGGDGGYDVVDPATGEAFAQAPRCAWDQLDAAMRAAAIAYPQWSADEQARCEALLACAKALSTAAARLAHTLTREQGKPLPMAIAEVYAAVAALRYAASTDLVVQTLRDDARAHVELVRRPVGVVAAIAPWNFPVAIAAAKLAPALRAGNAVVLKPSAYTPLATLEMVEVLRDLLPPGVLNAISGGDDVGAAMVAHPVPAQVCLTGSVATGQRVAAAAGGALKRVLLELGGNDAAIMLDDAQPQHLAEKLFWGSFANNGQACLVIKRLYVPRRRYRAMVDALADRARAVAVGEGLAKGSQLGPVTTRSQLERVGRLVAGALAAGGRVASGGAPLPRPGYFYPPTIVSDVDDGVPLVDEEQFGPVLPVIAYDDVDDALRRANGTRFGLGGSVWSADPERAWAVACRLECGTAWVNTHAQFGPDQPLAAVKCSGIGVQNGTLGLHEYTTVQVRHRPAVR